jgi:hypothetical protein
MIGVGAQALMRAISSASDYSWSVSGACRCFGLREYRRRFASRRAR